MPSYYKKVPDTTKPKKFPEPRKEPHQYKEPIGPVKPTMGSRILSGIGTVAHNLAPRVEKARRTGGKVQRYAATRSRAIDHNFGQSSNFNPNIGQGWMNMSFPGSGFEQQAPSPRRKRRKPPRQRGPDIGWGLPLY